MTGRFSRRVLFFVFLIFGAAFLSVGLVLLFDNLPYPDSYKPKLVTAYTDGILQKNDQPYTFSFQYKTYDQFAERNDIMVDVNALLPGVTSDCVKIRFEGAANYSSIFGGKPDIIPTNPNASISCQQTMRNEIVLFQKPDSTYQNKIPLTIQYGMNGNWGIWYFDPSEKQPYGHYVPNIIHISPADVLIQTQTNYHQNYFNIILAALTFMIAGATFLQLTNEFKKKDH